MADIQSRLDTITSQLDPTLKANSSNALSPSFALGRLEGWFTTLYIKIAVHGNDAVWEETQNCLDDFKKTVEESVETAKAPAPTKAPRK